MRYVLLQTTVGDYRQAVLQILVNELGSDFLVMSGRVYFDGTTKTRVNFIENNFRFVTNIFIFRKLSFQLGCWGAVISADVAILELNPRILSTWIILIVRRFLGKRTAVWGHAWSRKGPYKDGTMLRDWMCRIAGVVVAYTNREGMYFRERMPRLEVVVAPNSLYPQSKIKPAISVDGCRDVVYVGRLVADKNPRLLLEAFIQAVGLLPSDVRLRFVGAGPELEPLRALAKIHGLLDRVDFLGHLGAYEDIHAVYANALVSVSPGYVGLSLIQSLSFGVPMVIATDEPHAPEIEAASEGANCLFFRSNDSSDLARVLLSVFQNSSDWLDRRKKIADVCAESYTIEKMASGLLKAFGKHER